MARPIKRGIDYFPLDVDIFGNRHIRVLRSRYGTDGIALYIYLLCAVYSEGGCYLRADEFFIEETAADLGMSIEKTEEIINFLCKRTLLDEKLFKSEKVLTSRGIQERFQEAVKARGAKNDVEVAGRYWLLGENETKSYIKVVCGGGYSEEKHIKESKEKKKEKGKESKAGAEEIKSGSAAACCKEYGKYIDELTPAVREGIEGYISRGMEDALVTRLIHYAAERNAKSWQYVEATMRGNAEQGIRTLEEYERERKKRGSAARRGFNNYTDTNPPIVYTAEDIVRDMLEEG